MQLDNISLSHVMSFLPASLIQTCGSVNRRWSAAANAHHRQMMANFEKIYSTITGQHNFDDHHEFYNLYINTGHDIRFLEWVPSGMFRRPSAARMYMLGVIGNPVTLALFHEHRHGTLHEWENIAAGVTHGGHDGIIRNHWDWFSGSLISIVFWSAAERGNADIAQMCITRNEELLGDNPPPHHRPLDETIRDATGDAAARGHIDIVRLCLKNGGDPDVAMRSAVCSDAPQMAECIRLCHKHGCDVNTTDRVCGGSEDGDSEYYGNDELPEEPMISIAARHGNIDAVRTCLELGSRHVDAALTSAAIKGHPQIVRLCHRHGGNINAPIRFDVQTRGWSAVRGAAYRGHPEVVKICFELESTQHRARGKAVTPSLAIIGAVSSYRPRVGERPDASIIDTLRLCRSMGGNIDATNPAPRPEFGHVAEYRCNEYYRWPLIVRAAIGNDVDMVTTCLELGSALATEAMIIGASNNNIKTVRTCHRAGGDINARSQILRGADNPPPYDTMTAAACRGSVEIVQQCLEWGATNVAEVLENVPDMHDRIRELLRRAERKPAPAQKQVRSRASPCESPSDHFC